MAIERPRPCLPYDLAALTPVQALCPANACRLGHLASLVPTIVPFSTIAFSSLADAPLRRARSGIPIAIFEAAIGIWLLIKGLKQLAVE